MGITRHRIVISTSEDRPSLSIQRSVWVPMVGEDAFGGRAAVEEVAGGEEGPVKSAGVLVVTDLPWPPVDLRPDWVDEDATSHRGPDD